MVHLSRHRLVAFRLALLAFVLGSADIRAQDRPPVDTSRVDQYGDPLPPGAIARIGTTRLRHGSGVWSVAFSPDGKTIASGGISLDESICLWDAKTGKRKSRLQLQPRMGGGVMCVAFSPDGRTLVAGSYSPNIVSFWDVATGQLLRRSQTYDQGVLCVTFSRDGTRAACSGYDKTIRIFDARTGREERTLVGHEGAIYSVAFSPDGSELVSASEDKTVRLWQASTGNELRVVQRLEKGILTAAFHPKGRTIAFAGRDRVVRIWDTSSGRLVHELHGHEQDVTRIVFSPNGKLLASSSRDFTVRLWDIERGAEIRRFQAGQLDFGSVDFSPDGKTLVAGALEQSLCLWDVDTGRESLPFEGHRGPILTLESSQDGRFLASSSTDGTIALSDTAGSRPFHSFAAGLGWGISLAFSPDGHAVASAHYGKRFPLHDVPSERVLREFDGHENGVVAVKFSNDGKMIVSGGRDNTVRVWEATSGKQLCVLEGHRGSVDLLAFSPDDKKIASGSGRESIIRVWDLATRKEQCLISVPAVSLAIMPDRQTLLTADQDGIIQFWNADSGAELRRFHVPKPEHFTMPPIAVSSDSKYMASVGKERRIHVWELLTGAEVRSYEGAEYGPSVLAFGRDGFTLASGNIDSTILIWDLAATTTATTSLSRNQLTERERETLWNDVAGADAAVAYRAMWRIIASGNQGVALLRGRLRPAHAAEAGRVARLISELDGDRFSTREKATQELAELGSEAEEALKQALSGPSSPEQFRRAELLLARLEKISFLLPTRATAVLERIATADARALLKDFAKGAPRSRLTQEARLSLERLGKLQAPRS
jgi:WD40 repeat protein